MIFSHFSNQNVKPGECCRYLANIICTLSYNDHSSRSFRTGVYDKSGFDQTLYKIIPRFLANFLTIYRICGLSPQEYLDRIVHFNESAINGENFAAFVNRREAAGISSYLVVIAFLGLLQNRLNGIKTLSTRLGMKR